MMKLLLTPLFFTLLFAFSAGAHSAEKVSVYGEVKENLPKKAADGTDETLTKLLSIKGVDEVYVECKKEKKLKDIPSCIWDEVSKSPDLKKQVQEAYAKEATGSQDGRTPASTDSLSLTTKSKQLNIDYMSDPAVVELSKVLQKKLEESLIGDEEFQKDKKTIAVVDHAKFITIYQTELGKTIVNAFTSYCIEADTKTSEGLYTENCKDKVLKTTSCPLVVLSTKNNQETTIEGNIKLLKTADFKSNTDKFQNSDSLKWTRCISSVGNVCYTPEKEFKGRSNDNDEDKKKEFKEQIERSKEKACLIMDYVKSARKNLIMANDQKKFYEEYQKSGTAPSLYVENAKEVPITEKNSIDKITTVSSKEIESSYEKKNKELKKEMEKCIDDSGKIIDTEICKKYISTDTETKEKAFAEFGIRQFALESKIDDKSFDKKEVEKYLTEEGYEKSKITQMLSSEEELEQVKKEIKDRYVSEREAIITSMANKVSAQITAKNGTIEASNDSNKLKEIRDDFTTRSKDLKDLVHFNNIVSSYLEIDKGGGPNSRNVASLFAETENGAEIFKDDSAAIKKKAAEASLKQEKGENAVDLSVDTLNGLLKYSTEKTKEK